MPAPKNAFKAALQAGTPQMGCWMGLADPYISEITAGAGFDWIVVDGEHAPNDLRSVVAQLQVMAGRGSHPVVRPVIGETWMIKQFLDAGAQTLLVPLVESAAQARDLVRAVTYPPQGVRGVGAALARASDFGGIPDYFETVGDEICLLAQVENRAGLAALDDILAVDGIDGVFIGPADLGADLDLRRPDQADALRAVILDAVKRISDAGKAPGILTLDPDLQRDCLAAGALFVATNIDVTIFANGMRNAAHEALALVGRGIN